MPKGLSQRAYAERSGVSRPMVQKWGRSGRLVLYDDGSINAEASDARRRANADPSQPSQAAARQSQPAEAELSTGEGGGTTYLRARAMHEVLRVQRAQILLEEKRGALVDRSAAERLIFRLAREERDAWVTWPARVAALMAAEIAAGIEADSGVAVSIGTGQVQAILERHVREQLDALADFRVSLAAR